MCYIFQKVDFGVWVFVLDQVGVVFLEKVVVQLFVELFCIYIFVFEQLIDQVLFVDWVVMGLGVFFFEDDLGYYMYVVVNEF